MKLKSIKLAFLMGVGMLSGNLIAAQPLATLQLTTDGKSTLSIPVETDLNAISFLPDSVLGLVELKGGKQIPVPIQIEGGTSRRLHWLVTPSKATKRTYQLIRRDVKTTSPVMQAKMENGSLIISDPKNRDLLTYHYETVYPPKGVDTAYKRSGFIHPLNTPNGQALTRINAPDHYHHWGMWNPWTHVLFENDTLDFWNLRDRKGTVKFSGFAAISSGNVYAGYSALHEHVAFKKNKTKKIAINELQSVKIYNPGNNKYYLMDLTVQLSCASASPVRLLEYRYGGIGIRATAAWNKDNSSTLTSSGKTRKDADGSTARWCIAQGDLGSDYGGLEMMSYPSNYNYPEPLRIWPESMNGRGDVFLNFSPTKNKDWLLVPGQTYLLKYRFLVFNDQLSKEQAEEAWQGFANPPQIQVIKK